jgi:phosphoglycolate phosphatase
VTFFALSFSAMIDAALPVLDVDRDVLLDDLKKVHQRYHNSEQPFALLEAECVRHRFGSLSRKELADKLDVAFHRFNSVRSQTLQLYPGVIETLSQVRATGCRVVAHTEATVVNAQFRLSKLGLTALIDKLYAVEHLGGDHPRAAKQLEASAIPHVRTLKLHERKPDPAVLKEICEDSGVDPTNALYVGDSVARDVGMANAAGVHSVWARYGTAYDRSHWKTLVRITHWTEEDVRRNEEATSKYGAARPELVIDRFDELTENYAFGPARTASGSDKAFFVG